MSKARGFRRLFRLPENEARVRSDVAQEIAFHMDMRVNDLKARGYTELDARREAEREFGDAVAAQRELTEVAERRVRSNRRAALHEGLAQDIRSAFRSLCHDPVFAIGVIATLALAVGVNAAMFDVADRLLFSGPPHVVDPAGVVHVQYGLFDRSYGAIHILGFSYPQYVSIRDGVPGFASSAAYSVDTAPVGEGETALRAQLLAVTASYFAVTGLQPALGRLFTAAEDAPASPSNVVILSDGYWHREYGAKRDAIGRTITIAHVPYTIIGVAPPGFHGVDLDPVDLVVPVSAYARSSLDKTWATSPSTSWLSVIARIRRGVSEPAATAQATAAYAQMNPGYGRKPYESAELLPLQARRITSAITDGANARVQVMAMLFLAVTLIVLLIACANLANLLIARTVRRSRELGVRIAMGVSQRRLLSLIAAEALMLCVAGGIAARLLAGMAAGLARSLLMPGVEWNTTGLSAQATVYSIAVLVVCGVVLTFAPALQMRRMDVHSALKSGTRDGGSRNARLRFVLVTMQAALTVLLLICSGLFVRSLRGLESVKLGYTPDRVLVMRWDRRGITRPDAEWQALYAAASDRVRTLPQVEAAALSTDIPFLTSTSVQVKVPGRDSLPPMPDGAPYYTAVGPAYFNTLGTRIVMGRAFNASDNKGAQQVAIVDEAFASFVWPGENALGKTICMGPKCRLVVGVAENSNRADLSTGLAPQFFAPLAQDQNPSRALFVRVHHDDADVRAAVRRSIQSAEPGLPFASIRSLADIIDPMVRPSRLNAVLFSVMAVLALCVAIVGLYSVMSYAVTSRRHEMIIRLALGAGRQSILNLMMGEAALTLGIGILAGTIAALAAARWTRSLLFGVRFDDPVVYLGVAILITVAGLSAALVPALRSRRINAADALREV